MINPEAGIIIRPTAANRRPAADDEMPDKKSL